jgi:hypothetical protein
VSGYLAFEVESRVDKSLVNQTLYRGETSAIRVGVLPSSRHRTRIPRALGV